LILRQASTQKEQRIAFIDIDETSLAAAGPGPGRASALPA
jgi:hypothetical protein